ncbi:hypothetical protein [Conchiformibius steedae]|uniref:hypothetical protein n=1 Tax=Conchiformibius steedae TaxID=153493 RepID=UPI0026F03433|nr:hypothetical protein [Conchiformibius steedae]
MINLYQLLGIAPNAAPDQIRKALTTAAQQQSLPLDTLQKCQTWLLDADKRKQYNARLFAVHPEILENMMAQANPPAPAETEKTEPPPKPSQASGNLYELLGVKPNAPDALIRDAIKQAAENGMDTDVLAQARFHLLHKERRAKYNRSQKIANPVARTVFVLIAIWFAWSFINNIIFKPNKKTIAETAKITAPAADMSDFLPTRQLIPVGEPSADYHVIYYKTSRADGRLHVVVERQSTSGVSYAWRELDCANRTQRYMGTGDSLDAAMVLRPDEQMQTPAEDSSAGRTLFFACSELLQ